MFIKHAERRALVGYDHLGACSAKPIEQHELFGLDNVRSISSRRIRIIRPIGVGYWGFLGRRRLRNRRSGTLGTRNEDDCKEGESKTPIVSPRTAQLTFKMIQTLLDGPRHNNSNFGSAGLPSGSAFRIASLSKFW
jgi:hypothetical protein